MSSFRGEQYNSVFNVQTNVTPEEFGETLEQNGFTKATSADGTATYYTKGSLKYSVYPEAGSTGGPTAQVDVNGEAVAKIRLKD